jgi:hypothetical protein
VGRYSCPFRPRLFLNIINFIINLLINRKNNQNNKLHSMAEDINEEDFEDFQDVNINLERSQNIEGRRISEGTKKL